jgi:hypothetical protein
MNKLYAMYIWKGQIHVEDEVIAELLSWSDDNCGGDFQRHDVATLVAED